MGDRGPKSKPTPLKLLAGNPGRRPLNENEPQPTLTKGAKPPKWLRRFAKQIWELIVPELEACGVLTTTDLGALARYCDTWEEWHRARKILKKEGHTYEDFEITTDAEGKEISRRLKYVHQRPEVSIYKNYSLLLTKLEQEFGLTPSSRSRISAIVDPKKPPVTGEPETPKRGFRFSS